MDDIKVKIGDSADEQQESQAVGTEEMEMELTEDTQELANDMEMTLGGEDEMQRMEEIVGDKINEEQRANKISQSKRGPKGPRKDKVTETTAETTTVPKVTEKADIRNTRIMEREIKRGTIVSPQGRIEKTTDGDYLMLLASELTSRTENLKFEEVGKIDKLNDGKFAISVIAAEKFGEKFKVSLDGKSLVGEGEDGVIHDLVRVELHKPGRDKDVVEAYNIKWAVSQKKSMDEKVQRKAEKESKKEEASTEQPA
jgi:hypothetical protein